MCSLVVSVLDSPAVNPRSNPGSGSALLMSEKSQAVYYISSCHIDGRQPKPRISIFFKNTFISVFGRKYHSTQSVKKLYRLAKYKSSYFITIKNTYIF